MKHPFLLRLPFHHPKLRHPWMHWLFVSQSRFQFFLPSIHCLRRRRRVGTLATNTDDKDGFSASIDTFCSMYTSFPSTLTCFHRLESLSVAVSRPTGELGPLSDHIARNFSRFRFFFHCCARTCTQSTHPHGFLSHPPRLCAIYLRQ